MTLEEISSQLSTSKWLTPLNLTEERETFLSAPANNPTFDYPELPLKQLTVLLEEIKNVTFPEQPTSQLENWIFKRRAAELELTLQLLLARGTSKMSLVTQELFNCRFDEQTLKLAQVDAELEETFTSQETRTKEEVVSGLKEYLAQYEVYDWDISLSTQTDFYFRVKAQKKQILIGQNFNWDFTDFDTMLAHEIDGHVIRAINASHQTEPLLQKPLPFYIKTEEGLATFLGDYCSTSATLARKHHALKYLAGYLALTASFKNVFEFLADHGFTPELAFQRTFRLKRGFSDTSIPGLFAKEAMYYEGMVEVKKFLDNGGNVHQLYAGKVGLEDLPLVTLPEKQIIPERLTRYLNARNR